jgi:phosphate transport system substrate-binding protein
MKIKNVVLTTFLFTLFIIGMFITTAAVAQEKILRLSCSAQVAEAIGPSGFHAFEQASGIKLEPHICSSEAAVYRLIHGHSDIAGTSEGLSYTQIDYGYVETPFCTDPIAVIVNSDMPINDINVHQLRMIFSGQISNWKELGGPDQNIMVVIPSQETAAYKNFNRRVMRYRGIRYDLMAYKSTNIIQVVGKFSTAVSFISQGAAFGKPSIKFLKVGQQPISEKEYPFQQVFSFVTKGAPSGAGKAFIDYWRSSSGQLIIKEKGMTPITQ